MSAQVLESTLNHAFRVVPAHPAARTAVFHLEGELDLATAPGLSRALASALDERPSQLALDLRGLSFLDSSGASVLAATARRARDQGCALVLRSPGSSVTKILRLTGLDRLVTEGPGRTA